jgi:hypothetical protein
MSLSYDQLSAITEKKFIRKLVDNIFDSNILLKRLKEKSYESVDGGTSIVQPLNYAQVTASGWYDGADTLDTTDNEVITAADYAWKQIYASIAITRKDELKNAGAAAQLSLVKSKTQIAEKTIRDKMGDAVYNAGTDAKAIVGLRDIVDGASTVGGIDQSSFSWWQAGVDDTTSTTLTLALLQSTWNSLTIDSDSPTVATTTRTLFNSYWSLLQPQQRFQDSETAKGGFQNLMFNGVPVVADSKCPANHFFMLNENYLHLYYHPQENFRFEKFMKPINQNVRVAKVFWMGSFGSSNNRLHGKLEALTS